MVYFQVSQEVIEELRAGEGQPLIVQGQPEANISMLEVGSRVIRAFLGIDNDDIFNVVNKKKKDKKKKHKNKKDEKKKDKKKKNKEKAYSIFESDHDIESPNGWSVIVTEDQLDEFEDTDFGVLMVNLTEVSCSKLVLCHEILLSYLRCKFFMMFLLIVKRDR